MSNRKHDFICECEFYYMYFYLMLLEDHMLIESLIIINIILYFHYYFFIVIFSNLDNFKYQGKAVIIITIKTILLGIIVRIKHDLPSFVLNFIPKTDIFLLSTHEICRF
jgi:hypothetical protein